MIAAVPAFRSDIRILKIGFQIRNKKMTRLIWILDLVCKSSP